MRKTSRRWEPNDWLGCSSRSACRFRRCLPVMPRSCRSLFRHDVARLGRPAGGLFWREVTFGSILSGWHWSGPAQAVPGEIDAMGVVHEAVEDGVGIGRVADHLVPFVDGDLAGEEGRAAAVAFFEDFIEIAAGAGVERVESPIVENEQLGA